MEGPCCGFEAGRVFCTSSGYKRQGDGKLQLDATNSEGKRDFQLKDLYKGGECGRVKKAVFKNTWQLEVVVVAGA